MWGILAAQFPVGKKDIRPLISVDVVGRRSISLPVNKRWCKTTGSLPAVMPIASIASMVLIAMIALFGVAGGGCMALVDSYNARGAEEDMARLLKSHSARAADLDCSMVSGTRTFTCSLTFTTKEVQGLMRGLKLTDKPSAMLRRATYELNGCQKELASRPGIVLVHTPEYRPRPHLPGLDYLLLYHDPQSNQGCIRSSISYG